METLTKEIMRFSDDCKETEESKKKRNDLKMRIKDMLDETNQNGNVVIIGSCGNGFGMKNSDLDLTINFSPKSRLPVITILIKLQECLHRDRSSYTNVEVVSNATVPIIRFNYKCEDETLPCDISIDRMNNVFNTVLLKAYSDVDDRMKPLLLALKKWGKGARVIDSKNNRLASFTLSLMVIHYLQSGCHPNVLPSLQRTHPSFFGTSDQNVDAITHYIHDPLPQDILSFRSGNNKAIGELFIGFFDYYCSFNWSRDGISVRYGETIQRPLKRGSNNTCLYVEDPYEINCNTARGVFKDLIWNDIIDKFRSAKTKLKNGKSLNDVI